MVVKQNKLAIALTAIVSSSILVSCGGNSGATNNSVGSASKATLPNSSITKAEHAGSGTIDGTNQRGPIVSANGSAELTVDNSRSGNFNEFTSGNKADNKSQGNTPSDGLGVSTKPTPDTSLTLPTTPNTSVQPNTNTSTNTSTNTNTSTSTTTNTGSTPNPNTGSTANNSSSSSNNSNITLPNSGKNEIPENNDSVADRRADATPVTPSTGGSVSVDVPSVSVPSLPGLPNIGLSPVPKPVIGADRNDTDSDDTLTSYTDSSCASNACTSSSGELLATESRYASIDPNLTNKEVSTIGGKFIPTKEYISGKYLSDTRTVSTVPQNYSKTGYTGDDYKPLNSNWNEARTENGKRPSSNAVINNPGQTLNVKNLMVNGVLYLYNTTSIPLNTNNQSGANINTLTMARIMQGSTNLIENYRTYSLPGLQKQLGNSNYAYNPADFSEYNSGERSSFINTYISLQGARSYELNNYNPSRGEGYNKNISERDLENSTNFINGSGVSVGVVDIAVNEYHPLFEKRIKLYEDTENVGKQAEIARRYKNTTGYDLPLNHGTEVALVLGAKLNQYVHDYQGVAPKVQINAYEYILDTTNLAKTFAKAKEHGNSVVNSSFTFGKRDKANNAGLLQELRKQALDWKNAPLYVFASGNNDKPNEQHNITGLLSDIVTDETISPISLVVTGVGIDSDRVNAGKTGLAALNISPYAVHCGVAASNCLAGFFMNKVSNPELQLGFRNSYYNNYGSSYSGSRYDEYAVLSSDTGDKVYGTSFAAPQVSGVATLTKQMFPWMTANNLRQTLLTTATDLGAPGIDGVYGWGLVNADKALRGPAAFAFGDFVVDIEKSRLDKNRNTNNSNHWWFTNNIVGSGGLTYFNDSNYSLILTGDNSYTGKTKVLYGMLILYKSKSASPFEISADGVVKINSNSVVKGLINNFGYVHVNQSTIKNGLINQGTAEFTNATINGDVIVGGNAILKNSGKTSLDGNLELSADSIFISDIQGTLVVKDKAKLDGALGVTTANSYVPETGKVYQIIKADEFDSKFKRFSRVYSVINDDLSLLNFDVIYDDKEHSVFINYFQNRNYSNLSNNVATRLNANTNYTSSISNTVNTGVNNISRVLASAEDDSKRIQAIKDNTTSDNYSKVYNRTPSSSTAKKLVQNAVREFDDIIANAPTYVRVDFSGSMFAALDTNTQAEPVVLNSDANLTVVHELERQGDASVTLASTERSVTLTEDPTAQPTFELTTPTMSAAKALQSLSGAELELATMSLSNSVYSDMLGTNQYLNDQTLYAMSDRLQDYRDSQGMHFTINGNYLDQTWESGSDKLDSKLTSNGLTVGVLNVDGDQAYGLAVARHDNAWNESYSDASLNTLGQAVTYGSSDTKSYTFSTNYVNSTTWGGYFMGASYVQNQVSLTRHIMDGAETKAEFNTHSFGLNAGLFYDFIKHQGTKATAHATLRGANIWIPSFAESSATVTGQGLVQKADSQSFRGLGLRTGVNLEQDLATLNLAGQVKLGLELQSSLTDELHQLKFTSGATSSNLYDPKQTFKLAVGYDLSFLKDWKLSLTAEKLMSHANSLMNFNLGLGVKF